MPILFAEFIFTGVFERYPGLTIVGGEVGAGWVPFFKQELDDRYRRNRYWTGVNLSMLPSDYYLRNCKVGVVSDQFGIQNCDSVGVDTMMWCSDFPHHITDWPHSLSSDQHDVTRFGRGEKNERYFVKPLASFTDLSRLQKTHSTPALCLWVYAGCACKRHQSAPISNASIQKH